MIFKHCSLYLIMVVLNAATCATSSSDDKILERSKSSRPEWLTAKPNSFLKNDKRLQVYSVNDGETDLPLGLKKAQSLALDIAKKALDYSVDEDLKLKPGYSSQKSLEISRKIFQSKLQIDDIYYEKLNTQNKDLLSAGATYTIYTLIGIDRAEYDQDLKSLQ